MDLASYGSPAVAFNDQRFGFLQKHDRENDSVCVVRTGEDTRALGKCSRESTNYKIDCLGCREGKGGGKRRVRRVGERK